MCSGQWGAVDRVFSMRFSLPSKTDDSVTPGSSRRSNGRAALLWIDACSGEFQQRAAWEGVARGLQRFPLTAADTISFVSYQILPDGGFGASILGCDNASAVEKLGMPTVRRLLPQVQVSADIGCTAGMSAMRRLFANPQPFIQAAVAKAVSLKLSMYNLDVEINPHLISTKDAADMIVFVRAFASALHARGKLLSTDLGRCRLAGFGGQFRNSCANWTMTGVDAVVTMQTYWHQMHTREPSYTLADWEKEVAVNAQILGRERYIVGLDKGFGAINQSKAPGGRRSTERSVKILAAALRSLGTQQLRRIAVWGAKEVDDLFVSTLGAWLSEPERI